MDSPWVVNSSPLIVLGKAGLLELLPRLAGMLVVPSAVVREVSVRKEEALLLEFLEKSSQIKVEPDCELLSAVRAWDLGKGESQAISMAIRLDAACVVLDDLEARRCAKTMHARVIGSLGIIVKARQKGLIGEAKPMIERLRRCGLYLHDAVVAIALEQAGEQ